MGKEWVQYDPRQWDSDMICSVNIGLGAGSKNRDLEVLGVIRGIHAEVIGAMGLDNPFVSPDNIYNIFEKIVLLSGMPSAEQYFTRPDPEHVKRLLEAAQQGDGKEEAKMQMQVQIEQMKLQSKHQEAILKAEAQSHIERAQMEADQQVELAKLHSAQSIEAVKSVHTQQLENLKGQHSQAIQHLKDNNALELEEFKSVVQRGIHEDKMELEREKLQEASAARRERTTSANTRSAGRQGSV